MEDKQPWATCLFTDILLTHLEATGGSTDAIDYGKVFTGIEGFEVPAQPEFFLRDVNNWVPLNVPRELMSQCEILSDRSDFAPARRPLASGLEAWS